MTREKVTILGLLVVISATINSISCERISQLTDDKDCSNGLPNYHYYPYDCQKYFGCQNGSLTVFTCPDKLVWNDAVEACDVHEKTDCSNIIPFPDPDCSNGTNTYYLYPYDCDKFWECYNKQVYLMNCPVRTHWNDAIKQCDEHQNVDCSHIIPYPASTTASPTTPTTTTTTPAPTTTTPEIVTYTTPKIECTYDNTYYPYPYDCAKYYECSNGHATLMKCPKDLLWNDKLKVCDYAYDVDCSYVIPTGPIISTTSTTTLTTSTSRSTSTTPTTSRPTTSTTTSTSTLKPTPTKPTTTKPTTKPATTKPATTKPTQTTTISTSTIPPSRTTPRSTTTTLSPIPTPPQCNWETEYYPYPYDCSKYYKCSDNSLLLLECEYPLLWNNELKMCDHRWNVDCSYTITMPHTTSPTTVPPMVCSAEHQFFVYPEDCTKFYECINGAPVIKECPEAMAWNRDKEVCDFIGDVDCS